MKTNPPMVATDGVPRYYWKQCYEIGDSVHWALCDTESDKQKPHRVSCAYMVLHADYPTAIGGRPVSEEPMLVRIVNALNNDATLARLNGELSVLLTQARADRDREAAKVDKLDAECSALKQSHASLLSIARHHAEDLEHAAYRSDDAKHRVELLRLCHETQAVVAKAEGLK